VKVALLTGHPDSPYAAAVLRAINARGLRQVHVVAAAWKSEPRDLASLLRTHGARLPWVGLKWLSRGLARPLVRVAPRRRATRGLAVEVERQGGRFVLVTDANGQDCRQALAALSVDVLVLTGAPIVRSNILAVPRLGTLNAHQGTLPKYRGMNVIEWAIFEGSAPAVTVHFVDPGIDTGDIIASEEVVIGPGDTLEKVRARAADKQAQLLAWAVSTVCSGPLPRVRQLAADGRQYYTMHPRLRAVAQRRLAGGNGSP
jgi:folate-dependent phosphoribosylglycinamide formyltransferase PurN